MDSKCSTVIAISSVFDKVVIVSPWWFSGLVDNSYCWLQCTQFCCHLWYWIIAHTKPGKKYWVFSKNVSSVFLNFVLTITSSECLPEGPHIYIMKFILTVVLLLVYTPFATRALSVYVLSQYLKYRGFWKLPLLIFTDTTLVFACKNKRCIRKY